MGNIVNEGVINIRSFDDKEQWSDDTYLSHDSDLVANQAGGLREDMEKNMTEIANSAKAILKKRKHIYDWKTKNTSFIKLYKDLKRLGIKNNKFFLRIYDPDLIGVDVYSPILPKELQLKIFLECIINPWYWLREVCRIPVDGMPIEPGGGSEFLADRNNIASWYCYLNGIDHYDSKSRQLGKTQNAVAQLNYAFHFGALSATFLFFSKDFPMAKQNLYRLKSQRDMIPLWMQMRWSYKEDGSLDKGQDSATVVRNPVTNNMIKVCPRATSLDHAVKLGRGETASHIWMDECDFTPYNTEILDASGPAYNTASQNAKKNRCLFARVLTSTPGYLNTKEGKDMDDMINNMLVWEDSFYDVPINKIKSLLDNSKCNGYMYIEHSWKQLGKSYAWYKNLCKMVRYDQDKILREILLQRIQGNELSPFKKQNLVYIMQHVRTPIEQLDLENDLQPILIYEKINKKISYILSIDPAEGLSLNNTAFTLINPHTQMIVAEYKSPYISPPEFFRMVCKFMKTYCPSAMIVVESNRGRELINRFLESEYRFRLWYDADKLTAMKVINTDKYGSEKHQANQRRCLGFDTTSKTRPLLFSIIERFMYDELDKVNTKYLVKDVSSVQRKPNGTIILGAGDDDEGKGHGDVMMSYLIGLYVLFNAKNLDEFGIYPGSAEPDDPDKELTDSEKREQIQTMLGSMPDDLKELFQDVLNQTDPVAASLQYQKEVEYELRKNDREENMKYEKMLERSDMFMDPQAQQDIWRSTDQAIYDGYNQQKVDPNRRFNMEDYDW